MSSARASSPLIDESLVRGLVSGRFPERAHLPVRRVASPSWDNAVFRLANK
jgi:hypothetical protein